MVSRVNQALELMRAEGINATQAALRVGIGRQTVYNRIKELKAQAATGRERCPCCDALLPEGVSARKVAAKARKTLA